MTQPLPAERRVAVPRNLDTLAWLFMRYSGILLIPPL